MIDPNHKLSVTRQAKVLGMSRSTAYYHPMGPSEADIAWMALIDRLHLEYPFAGARMLRDLLRQKGYVGIGRRRIRRLMRLMGIEAIYRKANTSQPHPAHPVYPYLLTMNITYLPLRRGLFYLRGRHGLVQPKDPRLEALEHDACRILCQRPAGSHCPIWRP